MFASENVVAALVGGGAGLHAGIWGLYKDAPYEGFTWRQFIRSIVVAAILGPVLASWFGLPLDRASSIVLLFGLAYAAERAAVEVYKTFFREQDQTKFTIPMQLAVFGKPVRNRFKRGLVGAGYLAVIGGGLAAIGWLESRLGPGPRWLVALTVGASGGWFSAFGGAWKDAPIEGFQLAKFFRSPLISAGYAWVLLGLSSRWPIVVLGAIGYTVATIETYKTFGSAGKPPNQPILFPGLMTRRASVIPIFVAIWVGLLSTFVLAT